MKEQLLDILKKLNRDLDFETCNTLFDDKLLDSFDVIFLVSEIGKTFDVEITVEDLVPANFNSLDAIVALIKRLQDEE